MHQSVSEDDIVAASFKEDLKSSLNQRDQTPRDLYRAKCDEYRLNGYTNIERIVPYNVSLASMMHKRRSALPPLPPPPPPALPQPPAAVPPAGGVADCSICLQPPTEIFTYQPCMHTGCGTCVKKWYNSNKKCHVCRRAAKRVDKVYLEFS